MEEIIIQRVKAIVDALYKGNVSAFSKAIDMNQVTVNDYILGKRKPSLAIAFNILQSHKNISAEWLMRGNGNMESNVKAWEKAIDSFAKMIPDCGSGDIFESMYDEAQQEIKRLRIENRQLKNQLESRMVAQNGNNSGSNVV